MNVQVQRCIAWGENFMNSKLSVAILILIVAVMPISALAQQGAKKPTKADAQNVLKIISGDKGRTQTYCDIVKLGDQIDQAYDKQDNDRINELNQKMEELVRKLGPEYTALMDGLQDVDPESENGQQISTTLQALDKLCAN